MARQTTPISDRLRPHHHGTPNGYRNGCREDCCRQVWSEYRAANRRARLGDKHVKSMFSATEWMEHAACTSDLRWTGPTVPRREVLEELADICASCPVIDRCADYALKAHCDCGMYAGVWLPVSGEVQGHYNVGWLKARAELRRRRTRGFAS